MKEQEPEQKSSGDKRMEELLCITKKESTACGKTPQTNKKAAEKLDKLDSKIKAGELKEQKSRPSLKANAV